MDYTLYKNLEDKYLTLKDLIPEEKKESPSGERAYRGIRLRGEPQKAFFQN